MKTIPVALSFRTRRKQLVWFTGVLVVMLWITCEIVLHATFRLSHGRWLWVPGEVHRVGFVQSVADRRAYELLPGYRDDAARMTITDDGLRRTVPEPKLGSRRVVFLGDSVPFGWGVADDSTYPSAFQQLLLENGIDLAVINAAVPSYNIRQSLDRWTSSRGRFGNVTLIFLQAANDISLASHFQRDWTPDVTWASLRFQLPDAFRPRLSALTFYLERSAASIAGHGDGSWSTREVEINLRSELARFLRDREADGIRVVVLPIDPFYYQTKKEERNAALPLTAANRSYVEHWSAMVGSVNQCLADICGDHANAAFFDTRPLFDDADRAELYLDFIHLTVAGNRLLARTLLEYCKREGLLE